MLSQISLAKYVREHQLVLIVYHLYVNYIKDYICPVLCNIYYILYFLSF